LISVEEVLRNLPERVAKLEEAQAGTTDWIKRQNGALQRLGDEVKELREDMHDRIDEVKDLIHESKEKTEHKQSLNWKQAVTIGITILIGLPGSLWGFVQLVNFLSKR